jgi:hypothetical protein
MPLLECRTRHRGTGGPRCRDRPPDDPPSRRPPHQPLTRSLGLRRRELRSPGARPRVHLAGSFAEPSPWGTCGSQGGHRRLQMASNRASTRPSPPPPSSLLTWTRADCTDGVGRDQREFGLRPGSLRPALLDSSRRDTAERS